MTIPATLISRPVTLDQLVALSDEIAALARAGVPLDRGLRALAADMPGRIGQLAGDIGCRLEQGENLAKIMAESGVQFPPAYRAVIEAGVRAGRLPAALEEVARTARRIRHLRTSLGTALLYPLIVLLLAWVLFVFTVVRVLPVMVVVMRDVAPIADEWRTIAQEIANSAFWWGWGTPIVFLLYVVWSWYRSHLVTVGLGLPSLLDWGAVGSIGRMHRAGRMAALTDLLAALLSNDVPLDEAVTLASAAVGSPQLAASGKQLAERIRRGQIGGRPPAGFPPLLAWTLTCGRGQQLPAMLRRTAQVYRDEFERRGQWLALYVPLIATAVVGGAVVMIYALLSLGPWIVIMRRLAQPYIP
ncbi:MAG: type II secretion system F family protein [Planctomycetaceae bacterium]|nr:type II secretion system F family protein [Planctomycetaceae bacterium]